MRLAGPDGRSLPSLAARPFGDVRGQAVDRNPNWQNSTGYHDWPQQVNPFFLALLVQALMLTHCAIEGRTGNQLKTWEKMLHTVDKAVSSLLA